MAKSGKSKSSAYPNGKRRINDSGKKVAPRSLRPRKMLLEDCTDKELEEIAGIPRDDSKNESSW